DMDFGEARPELRRFLLQQLAAGAKDEQIARVLGISLRTVRRRVADLLSELGVDTRFQAGAEAVRRGWL
ncbi:MAG TPA: helix-turn-helix domain-containing protein, partial [Nocardioides sp.]|nr:helix-turn-helix domain-containing protein [Nocardioides sp.]